MGSRPQWCGAARRMRLRLNGGSDAPVDVFRRQASMFLLHDGTLITIFLNAETQVGVSRDMGRRSLTLRQCPPGSASLVTRVVVMRCWSLRVTGEQSATPSAQESKPHR